MGSPGSILYYVERWSDEVMPCAPTLEAWANWLSAPASDWNRDAAAVDGDRFETAVMKMGEDVVATRGDEGWEFSHSPEADFFAVRWGAGCNWDADSISGDLKSLTEILDDNDDDKQFIAVGHNQPSVALVYRAGPPARCEVEAL